MNVQFHATDQQEKAFQQLIQKVATIKQALSPYMDDRDAENIIVWLETSRQNWINLKEKTVN